MSVHATHLTYWVYLLASQPHGTICMPKAIARETQRGGWQRAGKVALIQKQNPLWRDLAEEGFDVHVDVRPALAGWTSLRSE